MIIKEIVYAPTAVKQYIFKFNNENSTKIEFIRTEILDGTSFVIIDLRSTSIELVYKFAYSLGTLQNYLAIEGESWLPLDEFPFPLEED